MNNIQRLFKIVKGEYLSTFALGNGYVMRCVFVVKRFAFVESKLFRFISDVLRAEQIITS